MPTGPPDADRLARVRLIAMDVDGVLTDAGIAWGIHDDGSFLESKTFNARDGLGISVALIAGLEIAWITGRRSALVERRASELGVVHVIQRARDKEVALTGLVRRLGLEPVQVLYIGDDLNDLPAFEAAGIRVAVADAAPGLQLLAHWVTERSGGHGAVREVLETVLQAQERWIEGVQSFLARLREEQTAEASP